MKGKFSSRYI